MRVIIPDDWNGEDWQCVQVAWPNSPRWTSLLVGLLTSPTRGRWYDETTGNIRDAQQIGLEIFDRNIPFSSCDGEMPQPETVIEYLQQAGIVLEGSESMGQVVTDVQIVGGKLRVFFGHCCYVDLDMSTVNTAGTVEIPQPGDSGEIEIPEGSPLETTTSCAKSVAVVGVLANIVDIVLDGVYSGHTPWGVMNTLREAYPGVSFGTADFATMMSAALNVTLQGMVSETESADFYQDLRHDFAAVLAASPSGVTAEEYATLKTVLSSVVNEYFNITTYPTAFMDMGTVHRSALSMIGENDIRNLTSYIAATGDENCLASGYDPSGPTSPLESGYFLSENFALTALKSSEGGTIVVHQASVLTRKIYGLVIHMTPSTAIPYASKRMDWTYGTEPFTVQADGWGNTSDTLQSYINAGNALVFFTDATIGAALAAQLGYTGHYVNHGGALLNLGDSISPGVMFGYCFASGLEFSGKTLTINEWRYVYKDGD